MKTHAARVGRVTTISIVIYTSAVRVDGLDHQAAIGDDVVRYYEAQLDKELLES